jgi:hypothetical protein
MSAGFPRDVRESAENRGSSRQVPEDKQAGPRPYLSFYLQSGRPLHLATVGVDSGCSYGDSPLGKVADGPSVRRRGRPQSRPTPRTWGDTTSSSRAHTTTTAEVAIHREGHGTGSSSAKVESEDWLIAFTPGAGSARPVSGFDVAA